MSNLALKQKRRYPRVKPTGIDAAFIDFKAEGKFEPSHIALIVDHSVDGGAGIAMLAQFAPHLRDTMRLKIGVDKPKVAKVVWRNQIDEEIVRLGIVFISKD
jgi:hypothetical protein